MYVSYKKNTHKHVIIFSSYDKTFLYLPDPFCLKKVKMKKFAEIHVKHQTVT